MKVSLPLSLKVTGWLLLNLLLLGAIGLGMLLAQGGVGWDSIVRGPAGRRPQDIANSLVARVVTVERKNAYAIVKQFGATYGATFYPMRAGRSMIDGSRVDLPEAVRALAREGPPERRPPPPPEASGGDDDFGPPDGMRPPPGPPEGEPRGGPHRVEDELRGRFLLRAGSPAAYWLGVRVAPPDFGPGQRGPVTVIARVDSWWALMKLLDLQSWLLAAATVFVASALLWLPFVRSLTGDIRRLTAATGNIAEGKFETRVDASRRDELGRLGESVNAMAARLDTVVGGQRRFLGDVTHELSSPLARLQVALEILERKADPAMKERLNDVREEAQQMAALVGELLAFTKAGMRPREAALEAVVLGNIAKDVLRREDPDARVRCSIGADLRARADAGLLSLALGNLIRNALRYAGEAGPIILAAKKEGASVIVTLEDQGPGVPPEALARLGEPFYRPESARTRETGGVGLGLAIVRNSIGACGGTVAFANRVPRGFRVEIRLASV